MFILNIARFLVALATVQFPSAALFQTKAEQFACGERRVPSMEVWLGKRGWTVERQGKGAHVIFHHKQLKKSFPLSVHGEGKLSRDVVQKITAHVIKLEQAAKISCVGAGGSPPPAPPVCGPTARSPPKSKNTKKLRIRSTPVFFPSDSEILALNSSQRASQRQFAAFSVTVTDNTAKIIADASLLLLHDQPEAALVLLEDWDLRVPDRANAPVGKN